MAKGCPSVNWVMRQSERHSELCDNVALSWGRQLALQGSGAHTVEQAMRLCCRCLDSLVHFGFLPLEEESSLADIGLSWWDPRRPYPPVLFS